MGVSFFEIDNFGRVVGWGCLGSEMKFCFLNMLNLKCLRNNVKLFIRELDILF